MIFLQLLQVLCIFPRGCLHQVQYLPTSGKLCLSSLTLLTPLLVLSGLAHAVCKLEVAAKSSGLQQLTKHMKLNQTAPKGDHVGFKGESSWWPKQVLLVASMLWAADGPYSISFSKSFLANRDNPSFDVCSLGYRCSQQALQFVFILAKPCLFLSRFDCYSEGWDSSFKVPVSRGLIMRDCQSGGTREKVAAPPLPANNQPLPDPTLCSSQSLICSWEILHSCLEWRCNRTPADRKSVV